MVDLIPFFIVLFAGLFFSELFLRFHFPWVLALILGGIAIGPSGISVFEVTETIEFFGQIGLLFLMFMAGLETKLLTKGVVKRFKSIGTLALSNSLIPFLVGFAIAYQFGFSLTTSLLIGTIFISSSIAIVVPTLENIGILKCRLGTSIVSSTIIADILSLVLLSFILQNHLSSPKTILLYIGLIIILILLRYLIPIVELFFSKESKSAKDTFQQELRSILVLLIGTVVIFQLLGLHPIIAGFFAGVVLSNTVTSTEIKEKLRGISYGIFIPIFFVVIGATTNISLIAEEYLIFTVVLILGTILAKFISGYLGGKVSNFTNTESLLIGASTIPQLSTTLAVAFSASELGLIDRPILSSLVLLSLVTTFIGPILVNLLSAKCNMGKSVCFEIEKKEEYYG